MSEKSVIVVGAGPAGLACAALLAQEGVTTTLVAPDPHPDQRTTALMQPSLRLLEYIGIWPGELQQHCAALRQLHLIDDTGNTVQSPDIAFRADELGLDAFGWNVPLAALISALQKRCSELDVKWIKSKCVGGKAESDHITLMLEHGGSVSASLAIAADGAHSKLRETASISAIAWQHDQAALITTFAHSAPHQDVSIEWHKSAGPFTTVPLPGNRSSLVWMDRPAETEKRAALSDQAFATEVQLETHGRLGRIFDCAPRKTIPMQGLRATRLAQNRVIVIGEAAHQQPPIGAQGLNLSLRDAGHVADLVLAHDDPGASAALEEYHISRMADIVPRQMAINFLNGSLLGELAPTAWADLGQFARVGGLFAIANIPPLRKAVMQQGLATTHLPFAMRA